jgi:hypothetical protein
MIEIQFNWRVKKVPLEALEKLLKVYVKVTV